VDVVVDAPADQVRARIGRWATVDPAGGGRCRVRMSTDSLDWPLMALGTVGAEFSVVSPPELVDQVRDWGGRFSRAARAG
jgi:predicted DNA-binding transcriptional regulator YafY